MIDPKMVEFSLYSKIEKHFLAKMESEDEAIVTDPRKAVYTLNSLCTEMDNRLELCKMAGARNIAEYNDKFTARRLNPEKGHRYLPYIVVVVDEFADLIMTAREVEGPVMRLAQKARAIGIHLIIATQRPDVKVITGGIKANFPARIAFRVMQMIDSRTIIDQPGANQLIGRGDMLFSKDGELIRIQWSGSWISSAASRDIPKPTGCPITCRNRVAENPRRWAARAGLRCATTRCSPTLPVQPCRRDRFRPLRSSAITRWASTVPVGS